jgi:hypothetical protein
VHRRCVRKRIAALVQILNTKFNSIVCRRFAVKCIPRCALCTIEMRTIGVAEIKYTSVRVGGSWCGRHPVASPTATRRWCGAFLACPGWRPPTHARAKRPYDDDGHGRHARRLCDLCRYNRSALSSQVATTYLLLYVLALSGLEGNGTWWPWVTLPAAPMP